MLLLYNYNHVIILRHSINYCAINNVMLHFNLSFNILSGNNVSRKVKHVMITMILLNDLNGLQKPDNNYTLVLYPGAESYETLKNALASLISDLSILKERGFDQIGGNH